MYFVNVGILVLRIVCVAVSKVKRLATGQDVKATDVTETYAVDAIQPAVVFYLVRRG